MNDGIAFVYGLAFYTLGITSISNRALASASDPVVKGRPFLFLFAIIHGAAEWLELSMFSGRFAWSRLLALSLHSLSFIFLGLFGLIVLGVSRRRPALYMLPPAAFVAWALYCHFEGLLSGDMLSASMVGRLFLSFPSSMLCSIALYRRAGRIPLTAPRSLPAGIVALAIVFALYSLFSGLVVDANRFYSRFGFRVELLRTSCAVAAAILYGSVNHFLEWQARQEQRESIRRANSAEERRRLADELHDTVIQELFATGLELELAVGKATEADVRFVFQDTRERLNATIAGIREFLAAKVSELGDIEEFKRLVDRALAPTRLLPSGALACEIHVSDAGLTRLSASDLFQLWKITEEAIRNAFAHSCLSSLGVRLNEREHYTILEIYSQCNRDPAFLPNVMKAGGGYGLSSMEHRARTIGAELTWQVDEAGSCLSVIIPTRRVYG